MARDDQASHNRRGARRDVPASDEDRAGRPPVSTDEEIARFLHAVSSRPVGPAGTPARLIMAIDATASREPSWDMACQIQGEMFAAAASLGGLEIQLVFYRGFGECKSTPWLSGSDELLRKMLRVRCLGGQTQIGKVLRHARQARQSDQGVRALVFIGDAMEEDIDTLCAEAGELGILGLPAFIFHEGHDPVAAKTFRQIARLSGGAYAPFDQGSARQLTALLRAVAAYAAGGLAALEGQTDPDVAKIAAQLKLIGGPKS